MDDNRTALGAFIRAHRERLPPTADRRRRTPGLRREEVAHAAGVSAIWYMRIEQGRAAAVSADLLARLAEALRLGRAERAHLFRLAARHDPATPATAGLGPILARTVAGFAGPAYVLDGLWRVRAANPAAIRLFGEWMQENDANLLRYVFVSPEARRRIAGWEERARRLLAEFRADFGRRLHDAEMLALVESLRADSRFFRDDWEAQHVLDREGGRRCFFHPEDGPLCFEQLTLVPAHDPGDKLVLLLSAA